MTEISSLGTDTPIPSPGTDLPHRISLEMGSNETK